MNDHEHEHDHEPRTKLLDPLARVALGPHGSPGFEAGETVDADGNRQLWIVDTGQLDADVVDLGNQNPVHEQAGLLPSSWDDRIAAAPLRCCRPTAAGRPCRQIVTRPGVACAQHRSGARR
ncbi:hypothetical protein ACIGKQ_16430 [Gordonia sp. NPDC062954]|uniref:hypothetical protein n=1 Tax=Gordonia sp. NPDC062954 TaxID=3364003 RepID=UPI0037C9D4E3